MAAARPRDVSSDEIELRNFGTHAVPGIVSSSFSRIQAPSFLAGDETAFAVYLSDASLMPVLRPGWVLYCTRTRDPNIGDLVFITHRDKTRSVRFMSGINEDGMELRHVTARAHDTYKAVGDIIPFDDLDEIAVVVGALLYGV